MKGNDPINDAKMQKVLSKPMDDLRQTLWDVVERRTADRGPLAIMRSQTEMPPLLDKIMTKHFKLKADEVLPKKRERATTDTGMQSLFKYLAEMAPQIGGLS